MTQGADGTALQSVAEVHDSVVPHSTAYVAPELTSSQVGQPRSLQPGAVTTMAPPVPLELELELALAEAPVLPELVLPEALPVLAALVFPEALPVLAALVLPDAPPVLLPVPAPSWTTPP